MTRSAREGQGNPSARYFLWGVFVVLWIGGCHAAPALHPDVAKEAAGWAQDALAAPVFCGDLVRIAYDPTKIADASPTYFNNVTGKVVAVCDNPMATRGKSAGQTVTCPPVAWTCEG